MRSSRLVPLAAIVAAVSLTACDSLTSSSSGNAIGVGAVSARTKGTGYTTSPNIAFYRVTGATFITADNIVDTCFLAAYSDAGATAPTQATTVGAGSFLTIQMGNRTDTLTRTGGALDPAYRSSLASGIPYNPGDSMVITVQGERGGYPGSSFRGRTAEPFTPGPFTAPAAGNPVTITWTPATDSHAAMFVTFRYAAGTSTTFNRQIACSFVDDGSATVGATMASEWLNATNRDFTMQRIRTILAQIDVPLSYFNIVSTFDWPTPASP